MENKENYSVRRQVLKETFNHVEKEVIEKDIIIYLLKGLPIEKLKSMVCFSEINPDNKELWSSCNSHLRLTLEYCKENNIIEYHAEIKI